MKRLAALFFLSLPSFAATYYVSNSGNDANNGTSPTQPWRTIAKVNGYPCTAGDTILLQAGGLWREMLTIPCSSLTITSYGSGAMPVLSGGLLAGPWTDLGGNIWRTSMTWPPYFPNFSGAHGIPESSQGSLAGLNEWYWDGSAYLYVYSPQDPSNVVEIPRQAFEIVVNGKPNVTLKGISVRAAVWSNIVIEGASSGFTANGISSTDAYWTGLKVFDNVNAPFPPINNGTIESSYFAWNGGSGIEVVNSQQSGWEILNNTVLYNCINPDYSYVDGQWNAGIHLYSGAGTGNALIQGNYVAYSGYGLPLVPISVATQGAGIWADTTIGTTISKNTVHDSLNSGIIIEKNQGTTVSENVSFDNGPITPQVCQPSAYTCGGQIFLRAGENVSGSKTVIVNNTLFGGQIGVACDANQDGSDYLSDNSVTSNVVVNASVANAWIGHGCDNDGVYGTGNTWTYNAFGASPKIFWQSSSSTLTSYSAFDAVYGQVSYSITTEPAIFVTAAIPR